MESTYVVLLYRNGIPAEATDINNLLRIEATVVPASQFKALMQVAKQAELTIDLGRVRRIGDQCGPDTGLPVRALSYELTEHESGLLVDLRARGARGVPVLLVVRDLLVDAGKARLKMVGQAPGWAELGMILSALVQPPWDDEVL